MKEYIEKRIKEVRQEKNMWLDKLEKNENEDYARTEYLISYSVLAELLEIQERMEEDVKVK